MSSDQSAERRNDEATRSVKIQFHSILLLGTNVHERQVFRVDNTAATFFFSFNFQEAYNTFQRKRHLRDWKKWIDRDR